MRRSSAGSSRTSARSAFDTSTTVLLGGGPALGDRLTEAERTNAAAARLRTAAAELERDAGVAPAAWAMDVFALSVLPLLLDGALLLALLVFALLKIATPDGNPARA